MSAVIELTDVKKHYKLYPNYIAMGLDMAGYYKARFWEKHPGFPIKRALNGVSLTIKRGERVGIIGRNGAGKTTLLKLASHRISPTSGKIKTHGQVQLLMRLGAAFHPDFSGGENIRHSLLYNGLRGKELERAYDEVIDFVELGDFIDQPMRTYSLGMATRLQFAVATAITPDILIIDELLGAGDAYFAAKSSDRMRTLTKSGCTLLLVSHARAQIMEFCTSAIWLDQGMVRQQGDLMEVTAAYDKAIAEAISTQNTAPVASIGLLPIPGHLRHPDYLNHIREAVNKISAPLAWQSTEKSGAQFEAIADHAPATISTVEFFVNGHTANHCSTGDAFKLQLTLDQPTSKPVAARLMVFSNGGDLIGMNRSPDMAPGTSSMRFTLPQMTLGHRDCLLAVILESEGRGVHALTGLYLKIMETNDSDPPLLHYPAKWYQNNSRIPLESRISGIQ